MSGSRSNRLAILVVIVASLMAWTLLPYQRPMTAERVARYGKWAVVAGASEGLGAAWADALASEGLNIVLISRSEKKLVALADELRAKRSVEVVHIVQDLAQVTTQDVREKIIADREIGLFVYNAAYAPGREFLHRDVSEHLSVHQLNMNALVIMTHELARHMQRNRHGGIVLMSSMAGTIGTAYYSTYAASKTYITSLSRALWYELKPHGIDVTACIAGATTTPNYLKVSENQTGRSTMIEQTAEAVVAECLSALGSTAGVATGAVNKISELILRRLLPTDFATSLISYMTLQQTGGAGALDTPPS